MNQPPTIDGIAFSELRALLEEWATDNKICAYPELLARDAANYIHDQLLVAGE